MSKSTILLTLANREENKHLILSAVHLCHTLKMHLEVLHVLPLVPSINAETGVLYGSTSILSEEIYNSEINQLSASIREQIGELPISCEFSVFVELGQIESAVSSRLNSERKYEYLIVGLSDTNINFIGQFFSTAVSLINHSIVPVIAIPPGKSIIEGKNHVMVVDSLSTVANRTSKTAVNLARALHSENLFHLFVKEDSEQQVDTVMRETNEHSFEARIDEIDLDHLYQDEECSIKNILKAKIEDSIPLLQEQGIAYEPLIKYGKPPEKIKEAIDQTATDIIIFGGRTHGIWDLFHPSHMTITDQIRTGRVLVIVPAKKDDFEGENRVAA